MYGSLQDLIILKLILSYTQVLIKIFQNISIIVEKLKKRPHNWGLFLCSGDRTRTCDLWVMSPTSYQLLHPAI